MRRPRSGILLAIVAAAPALALAQAQGATDPSGAGSGARPVLPGEVVTPGDRGALDGNFRAVPRDAQGNLQDYAPPAPPHPETVALPGARLKLLDKMTGQVREVDLKVGETKVEDRLELALLTCRAPEEDVRQDAFAYLKIRDLRDAEPRFAGWMFASSPALSAMDHARYDVWVLNCSTSAGDASGARR